jgi:hypothetical protein
MSLEETRRLLQREGLMPEDVYADVAEVLR